MGCDVGLQDGPRCQSPEPSPSPSPSPRLDLPPGLGAFHWLLRQQPRTVLWWRRKKTTVSQLPSEARTPPRRTLQGIQALAQLLQIKATRYPQLPEGYSLLRSWAELGLLRSLPAFPESGLMAGAFLFTSQGWCAPPTPRTIINCKEWIPGHFHFLCGPRTLLLFNPAATPAASSAQPAPPTHLADSTRLPLPRRGAGWGAEVGVKVEEKCLQKQRAVQFGGQRLLRPTSLKGWETQGGGQRGG